MIPAATPLLIMTPQDSLVRMSLFSTGSASLFSEWMKALARARCFNREFSEKSVNKSTPRRSSGRICNPRRGVLYRSFPLFVQRTAPSPYRLRCHFEPVLRPVRNPVEQQEICTGSLAVLGMTEKTKKRGASGGNMVPARKSRRRQPVSRLPQKSARLGGSLAALGMTGESRPVPEAMGSRFGNAPAPLSFAPMTGGGLPQPDAADFRASKKASQSFPAQSRRPVRNLSGQI